MTPKARMLAAYRGQPSDRPPVAPEFWYYYPAKVMGVDMLEFSKVPFHIALKKTFEYFDCEGWGITGASVPVPDVTSTSQERWEGPDTLIRTTRKITPWGTLESVSRQDRHEPGWAVERWIKDLDRDLPAWEHLVLGGDPARISVEGLEKHRVEVGESYLLECALGVPFFDFFAESRQGGLEQAVFDITEREDYFNDLQQRYIAHQVAKVDAICAASTVESFMLGCSWSCVTCIGPHFWRRWDVPVIRAMADAAHRHGRLLHIHFHGRCRDVLGDLATLGCDCICPFERGPGGDINGLDGLRAVRTALADKVTMNGNVHTVETLIRGTPDDVRREVDEILEAFAGSHRLIVGTGDQVGGETPEDNLYALIDRVKGN